MNPHSHSIRHRTKENGVSSREKSMDPTYLAADDADGDGFTIASNEAYVATATVACRKCHAKIEVICIHCENGSVRGEPLTQFTVSDVWAIDDALARQLEPWPAFRRVGAATSGPGADPDLEEGGFAN